MFYLIWWLCNYFHFFFLVQTLGKFLSEKYYFETKIYFTSIKSTILKNETFHSKAIKIKYFSTVKFPTPLSFSANTINILT